MEWIFLICAGALEIIWSYTLSISHGFTILIPSLITIVLVALCFFFLEKSIAKLGIGVTYACFTAIGSVGTYIVALVLGQQQLNIASIFSLAILLMGIIGLKTIKAKGDK
ncbi:MAG: multidrug efflux SMR transporter [Erysipelotrichales bacterium]